jgi:hypothetical protein
LPKPTSLKRYLLAQSDAVGQLARRRFYLARQA